MQSFKFLIFFLLTNCCLGLTQNYTMQSDSFQVLLNRYLAESKAPAIVASLFTKDSILNMQALGKLHHQKPEGININHALHLGSNTKAMTGFIAAYLVEQGLIEWHTRFLEIFPILKKHALPVYTAITLQDLLIHRAYIKEFTEDEEFELLKQFDLKGNVVHERIEWCKWLLSQEPILEYKQNTYTYSNAGYSMATAMLEKVSGKNWEELIQDIVFDSLEIDGGFSWPTDVDTSQPYGHFFEEGTDSLVALSLKDGYKIGKLIAPAGDIHMSMPNYVKWLQANMKGLSGQDIVIKSSTYDYLHSLGSSLKGYKMGWGSGWVKMGAERYSFGTHNGSGGTFYCSTFIIPELNVGIAIMSNAGDDLHEKEIRNLRNKLLKHIRRCKEKN